jgi:hypothetical protein
VAITDAKVEEGDPPGPAVVPFVDVNPCLAPDGTGEVFDNIVRVYMPRVNGKEPAVKMGDVISYGIAYPLEGVEIAVCVSDYLGWEDDDHLVLASDDGDTPGSLDTVLAVAGDLQKGVSLDGNLVTLTAWNDRVAVDGGEPDYLDNVLVAGNGVTLDVDVNTLVLAAEAEDPDTDIDTLGPVDESGDPIEGTEPELDDTWTANGTKGLALWQTVRVVYYELGDEKLYEYRRKLTFDRWGRLYSVSGEKQIEIEAPEPCS